MHNVDTIDNVMLANVMIGNVLLLLQLTTLSSELHPVAAQHWTRRCWTALRYKGRPRPPSAPKQLEFYFLWNNQESTGAHAHTHTQRERDNVRVNFLAEHKTNKVSK